MTTMQVGRAMGLAGLIVVSALGLSGCDYWPPALQAQIEQLKADAQAVAAEKAKVDASVATLTTEKTALIKKVEELSRLLKTRSDQVASLEQSLAAEREKVAKLSAKSKKKAAAKRKARKRR